MNSQMLLKSPYNRALEKLLRKERTKSIGSLKQISLSQNLSQNSECNMLLHIPPSPKDANIQLQKHVHYKTKTQTQHKNTSSSP
jgi:hypothetical protein